MSNKTLPYTMSEKNVNEIGLSQDSKMMIKKEKTFSFLKIESTNLGWGLSTDVYSK